MSGTNGRVYGGDPGLVHIPDGERAEVGQWLAGMLGKGMRVRAVLQKAQPGEEGARWAEHQAMPLCPGCYMVALFNAAVALAKESGQPLAELGRSMAGAFNALADCPEGDAACIESIQVKLDGGVS